MFSGGAGDLCGERPPVSFSLIAGPRGPQRLMKGGVSNGWTQGAQVSIQSSPTEADLPLPVWKSKVEGLGEVLGGKQQLASEIQGELQPLWTWLPFMKNPTPPTLETPKR